MLSVDRPLVQMHLQFFRVMIHLIPWPLLSKWNVAIMFCRGIIPEAFPSLQHSGH